MIRRLASAAMASAGEEAMPFVLRGLRSGDTHRVRAACDAISGFEGWSYRRMKSKKFRSSWSSRLHRMWCLARRALVKYRRAYPASSNL